MACTLQEANKKHSVNGFIFCNMPEVTVPQDAQVRFVLIGVGGETDMHTPGFTNHLQQTAEGAGFVVELFPGAGRISNLLAGVDASPCVRLMLKCVMLPSCSREHLLLYGVWKQILALGKDA